MKIRYLGKTATSDDGACPAAYETDRGTYIIQGKVVTDQEAIAAIHDVAPDESYVEVPPDVIELIKRQK